MNKFNSPKITAFMFSIILGLFFLLGLFLKDKDFSSEENRMLETFPELKVSNILDGRFESNFEKYANDQMPFRNNFIRIKTSYDRALLNNMSNGVFMGSDNYLLEDITKPKSSFQKESIDALKKFKGEYGNLKMYFLLAPNAANIYSDKLPFMASVADQNKFMSEYFKALDKIGIQPIDIRKAFNKNKDKVQLYYRTDHHWTSDGAYIAFKEAFEPLGLSGSDEFKSYAVKNDFKGTLYSKSGFVNGRDDVIKIYIPKDKTLDSVVYYVDTKEKTTNYYKLDNLKKKDAYTVFGGSNHPLYTIQTPIKNNKRLLLIKDSYANSLIPMLMPYYREIVVVDPRYYYDDIKQLISSHNITEVLFLYNANTFFADTSLNMMING